MTQPARAPAPEAAAAAPPGAGLPRPNQARWRREGPALAGLTLLVALAFAVIGIGGDFPLNDDWAYSRTVQHWLETGRLERSTWTWSPSYTNSLIGAGAAEVFGFSHRVLRATGILLGWLGVLATYALARRAGVGRGPAFLAGAALAANPVHVNLAWTFMTDVPFATLTTLALLLLAKGLRAPAVGPVLGGCGLAVLAVLSRAPGLALAAAAAGAWLATHPPRWRSGVLLGAAGLALGVLYEQLPGLLFDAGDAGRHLPLTWYLGEKILDPALPYFVARSGLASAWLLGIFLLPLVALRAGAVAGRPLALGAAGAGAAGGLLLGRLLELTPPFSVNVIWNLGLGARSVPGREMLPALPEALWWGVSALGLAVAGFALAGGVATAWARRRELAGRSDLALLALFTAIYLAGLSVQWPFFDRWLLAALPPLFVSWLAVVPRPARPPRVGAAVAGLALLVLGAYAVLGTADALRLQGARWALLDDLVARGVPPARIDGGFEFNGWHHADDPERRVAAKGERRYLVGDTWRVTLDPELDGYVPVDARSARRWLPPGESRVYLHRRKGSPGGGAPQPSPAAARKPAPATAR